jgi:hypothetical protein
VEEDDDSVGFLEGKTEPVDPSARSVPDGVLQAARAKTAITVWIHNRLERTNRFTHFATPLVDLMSTKLNGTAFVEPEAPHAACSS